MVKSFASQVDGAWLQAQADAAIHNASHRFNGQADPLYSRAIAANLKSEMERRTEQSGTSGETSGGHQPRKNQASKPAPALKPRSQQGRGENAPWLAAQYQAALRSTKPRFVPNRAPSNAQQIKRGQSPSR